MFQTWPGSRSRPKASALAGLEPALGFVDHVKPPLAAHEAVVAVATTQRFQRVTDLHRGDSGRPRGRPRVLMFRGWPETKDVKAIRQLLRDSGFRRVQSDEFPSIDVPRSQPAGLAFANLRPG